MSGASANHEGSEGANAEVDTAQVGVQNLVPGVGGQLVEWAFEAANAGVVDEDVEAAESPFDVGG